MQTSAPTGPTLDTETAYPRHSYGVVSFDHTRGNTYNNISFGINHGSMQDAGINQAIARELQKLKDMISSVCGEPLRQFLTKFGQEALEIPNLDVSTAVEALKMGLQKDSQFYQDLVMTPCRNLDEVQNRALRLIRLEEDQMIQDQLNTPTKNEFQDRRQGSYYRNNNSKPYSKPNNQKINVVEEEEDDEDCLKISNYCFSVDMGGVMLVVRNLGDKARWPRKNEKAPAPKDKSKWCTFHEDFGHMTEECIALRKEIRYLLGKGYLKELFGRKKSRTQDPESVPKKDAPPPPDAQVINMIF
ncbi:uncharacterized protein LOC143547678 [Bidens hawaiensis]|uniref:uncharacterized protein LOC143547678 n=1 Tax=Bidens hawaiensis TaxID=980011 RepID=UPI0040494A99